MQKLLTGTVSLGLVLAMTPATSLASPERLPRALTHGNASTATNRGEATITSAAGVYSVRLRSNPLKADQATILAEQEAFIQRHQQDGIRVIARTRHVLNAVFIEVAPSAVSTLADDAAVSRVTPVSNYELDLSETVPYIGASAVQAFGVDGTGVSVAVLDSGIDYEHADLGGSGLVADYAANDRNVIETSPTPNFPTAKVIGGFDFVGETWPDPAITGGGPLAPDPDPLDFEGHGTHVADIIAGSLGVAPGASLYAVKVCSAISSSCNGVALIQGMDFSADPNGDGDTSDHVDIINMSLGSNYGQPFDDDLAVAVENATALGILTVASAGNGGDNPFVTGTPAAAESAISVAQTAVPSSEQSFMDITTPAVGLVPAVFQPWSVPQTAAVSGPVTYGDGAGGNLNGCAPFATPVTGIVLVDRGACAFSVKIANIGAAGGTIGIIGLIDGSTPFPGAFGGGTVTIPGYMITQAAANAIRSGGVVSFDPANAVSLAGSMVSSSSRGPRNTDNLLKPEIGAPGASISANAGMGTTRSPFGGTSGAAPMVSGAAALVMSADPGKTPQMIKQRLMNTADRVVARDFTGVQAEVSRIGAGELFAFAAWDTTSVMSAAPDSAAALSMGYVPISKGRTVITKEVKLYNDTPQTRRYSLTAEHRYAADAASGAIQIRVPRSVRVGPFSEKSFRVRFIINGNLLPNSSMNSAAEGNNAAALTATEFGGYIIAEDVIDEVSMPWHIIPRKSADLNVAKNVRFRSDGTASVNVRNRGVGAAHTEAFDILAFSPDIPTGAPGTQSPTPDLRAVGVRTTPVPAGFCGPSASFLIEFAFNTWEPQNLLFPVLLQAAIDTNNDGTDDYLARAADIGFFFSPSFDARSGSIAVDLAANTAGIQFFAVHATNTANTIITFCAEQFGMTAADLGTKEITVNFNAFDFYFGGPGDSIAPVRFTVGGGYQGTLADIPANSRDTLQISNNRGVGPNIGLMLFADGDRGPGNRGGATPESTTFIVPNP